MKELLFFLPVFCCIPPILTDLINVSSTVRLIFPESCLSLWHAAQCFIKYVHRTENVASGLLFSTVRWTSLRLLVGRDFQPSLYVISGVENNDLSENVDPGTVLFTSMSQTWLPTDKC